MSSLRLFLLVPVCLLAAAAIATPVSGPLSLDDALQRAAGQNPALAAEAHNVLAADAYAEQAGQRPMPTLDVALENFAGTGPFRGVDGIETTVQASQRLERGGKRAGRLDLAQAGRLAADEQLAVRRAAVLADTAAAYIETLTAQQRLALAVETLALAEKTVTDTAGRVLQGDASPAESTRARVALALARAGHRRAESALQTARATLAAQWGAVDAGALVVTGGWTPPDALPDRADLLAKLAAHPRLRWQQAVTEGRRAALRLERAQAVSDVTVAAGVRFQRVNSEAAFVAGFSLPLPFNHPNQGNIRAARRHLDAADQTVAAVELELRLEFASAWQDLTTAHDTLRLLRTEALPAAEETVAIVSQAHTEGMLALLDLLDARRELAAIRLEILSAETALANALARLDALTDPTFPLTNKILYDQ